MKKEIKPKIEQGIVVKVPSLIHTGTIRKQNEIEVFVGGTGVIMLEGNFLV